MAQVLILEKTDRYFGKAEFIADESMLHNVNGLDMSK